MQTIHSHPSILTNSLHPVSAAHCLQQHEINAGKGRMTSPHTHPRHFIYLREIAAVLGWTPANSGNIQS